MTTVSELAKKSLEQKWYPIFNSGVVTSVFSACSFCDDAENVGCNFCKCPHHICYNGGWDGLVHRAENNYKMYRSDGNDTYKNRYWYFVERVIEELEKLL